jgi:hypothetical protein
VWVFGGGTGGNGTWHLRGRKWTKITGPGSDIFRASALSAHDMWAIGGAGANEILHYSSRWHVLTSSVLKGLQFGSIFANAPGSVWVTASPNGKTGMRLLHLHGTHWTAYTPPWTLGLSAVDPGGLPFGGLSADGHGGFWLSGFKSPANWVLHFSSSGKWSRSQFGRDQVGGITRAPGAKGLLAVGTTPQNRGRYPFTNAMIWARAG